MSVKIVFVLLVSLNLVWSDKQPLPLPKNITQEKFTIILNKLPSLTPWESEVVEVKASFDEPDKQNPIPTSARPATTTSTASTPLVENSVPIDLSERLFYANHEDSQRGRKTLDLSGLDLSGEDVMRILHGLNSTTLSSVARLDLSHNRVLGLPPRVWPLELEYSLCELSLDHNRLGLDDPVNRRLRHFELLRLRSLQKLSLSHCGLTTSSVSSDTLEYPPIESLDLSYNQLVDLPSSLTHVPTLRHLDVSGNRLRYLSGSPLSSLTGLQTLNLSNNGLERMWDDPIEKLYSLETLHLDHNALSEPPKLYQYTGSYQPRLEVYMSANPFKCGCSFKNTLDITRLQVLDKFNVTCVDSNGVEWSVGAEATQCSPHLEAVREKWSGAKEWIQDNRPDWSTLYRSLGWVLFGVTLGLVYAHRRAKKTPPPSQVPYNILDDRAAC